ncbi:MAG: glycosyltransferase family 39 protein [Leptolyngbya sp. BL-A-14]
MNAVVDQNRPLAPTWLRSLVLLLLVVGIVFRFVNLNHKVYWHDEVVTSLRAAGYTQQEVVQHLFQNHVIPTKDLLRFQQIKPGSTPIDTVRSLVREDPKQPPFYHLLDRLWIQGLGDSIYAIFGSPITAPRLLPALLSVLTLPVMYALAWELFASHAIALLATAFLAVSPFDVVLAQTACQTSFLGLTVIASHYLLLRACRLANVSKFRSRDVFKQSPSTWQHWGWYGLSATVGLYTHPVFALALLGQAIWLMQGTIAPKQATNEKQRVARFWLSLLVAGLLYVPWLLVSTTSFLHNTETNRWAVDVPSVSALAKQWLFSLTALLIDLNGFDNGWTFGLRLFLVGLMILAFYTLYRRSDRVGLFVLSITIVPFVILMLADVVLQGSRSTVNRYLLLSYSGVQLAIAHFLAARLAPRPHYLSPKPTPQRQSRWPRFSLQFTPYTWTFLNRWFWRMVLLTLFAVSLTACTVSAASFSWQHGDQSDLNAAIAARINADPSPLLLSEAGENASNLSDLISLSYKLTPNVRMLLLGPDVNWVTTPSFTAATDGLTVLGFRPSSALKEALERSRHALQPFLPGANVWLVSKP